MIPLNWKSGPPPSHSGVLMPLNQQAKKAITVLTELIDPDHQVEYIEAWQSMSRI